MLITTDQQRYDTLGCNGADWMPTPALDALAAEGARFQRAYCTNPVCTPSRVSIMTGNLPGRHGSYNIGTRAKTTENFLSTRLTAAGYRTHHIGKAHFYPWDCPSEENLPQFPGESLRNFAGFETAELTVGHSDWGVTGHYEQWLAQKGIVKGKHMPQLQVKRLFPGDAYGTGDWGMPPEFHSGQWIVERTEAFLREAPKDRPFFLNLGFQDPHHPLAVPKAFPKLPLETMPHAQGSYDTALQHIDALAQGKIENSRFSGPFGIAGNQNTRWLAYTEEQKQVIRQYYYTMMALYDQQIGQLMEVFKKYGAYENTLFLVTTDHGDMLFDHGIGEKGPLAWEEVLHVPLLITAPGLIAPRVVDTPVSLADLLPTVLEYAGLPPTDCDGCSLLPLLEGENWERQGVCAEFMEEPDRIRYRCYITNEWKLVEYPGESFGELYHLAVDPHESQNLFALLEYQTVKRELEQFLPPEPVLPLAERPCRC